MGSVLFWFELKLYLSSGVCWGRNNRRWREGEVVQAWCLWVNMRVIAVLVGVKLRWYVVCFLKILDLQ